MAHQHMMDVSNNLKSNENTSGESGSSERPRRSFRSSRHERRLKRSPQQHLCGRCVDTSIAGLCNTIGTTAFYLAYKFQGVQVAEHGENVKPLSDLESDQCGCNLSRPPNTTQSSLLAPLDHNINSSSLVSRNRLDRETTIQERHHHMMTTRTHLLKLAQVQTKLTNCSMLSCDSAFCGANCTAENVHSHNQAQIRVAHVASDTLNATVAQSVLCSTCGHLSSYDNCTFCTKKNNEDTALSTTKMPLSTANDQQLGNDTIHPKSRGYQTIDTDKSSNDENVQHEHDVRETMSENETQDRFNINLANLVHVRKRKTYHRHAVSRKEDTGENENMSQRYDCIRKRLLRKEGQTYIRKSRDSVKKVFNVENKPVLIEITPTGDNDFYCTSVFKRLPSCPGSVLKRLPYSKPSSQLCQECTNLTSGVMRNSQDTDPVPTGSQFNETLCVNKDKQETYSALESSLEVKHVAQEEQRKQVDVYFLNEYLSGANKSDERSDSLCNFVGSSASLEVDVIYKRLAKSGPKETHSNNQWPEASHCNIPFVDGVSVSTEAKFINPSAMESNDSLYRGSTLSLELSDVGESVPENASISYVYKSEECERSTKSSRPLLGKECHSDDEASRVSMFCHIGNASNVGSVGYDGTSKSVSYNLSGRSDCYNQQKGDKAMYLQGRLRKSSRQYGLVLEPEMTKGDILGRHGHRGSREKSYSHGNDLNFKPKSDVMGASPEGTKKSLYKKSNVSDRSSIQMPIWLKIESIASELLDICSKRGNYKEDKSLSLKCGNDMHVNTRLFEENRVRAAEVCIQMLHQTLMARRELTTSKSSD